MVPTKVEGEESRCLLTASKMNPIKIDRMKNGAEHPTNIPMDSTATPQVPSGSMTEHVHASSKMRLTRSSLNYLYIHTRHDCYLKQRPCAYTGTRKQPWRSQGTRPDHGRGGARSNFFDDPTSHKPATVPRSSASCLVVRPESGHPDCYPEV